MDGKRSFKIVTRDYVPGMANIPRSRELKVLGDMADDLMETFPWINVIGFGPGFTISTLYYMRDWNERGEPCKKLATKNSFSVPVEIVYTMLQLSGVDVSKYGLEEVWE